MRVCKIEACQKKHYAKGYCFSCYVKNVYYPKNRLKRCKIRGCRRRRGSSHSTCYKHNPTCTSGLGIRTNPKLLLNRIYGSYVSVQKAGRNVGRGGTRAPNLRVCSRAEFVTWAVEHPVFKKLYKEWQDSGFASKLIPSIRRLGENAPFSPEFLGWFTRSAGTSFQCRMGIIGNYSGKGL